MNASVQRRSWPRSARRRADRGLSSRAPRSRCPSGSTEADGGHRNGYCERPAQIDCNFECICESCSFFTTSLEFRPTLLSQRDDAAAKGQTARQQIYDGLLQHLDQTPA